MGWAEIDAAHRAYVCPVGTALARDVSIVTLEDHAIHWHGEADGTLQGLCHLRP